MINKFDTYSEIMTDLCMKLPRWIFEMSAISRYGGGFFGLIILIIKYEKNLITIFMSFIKICLSEL